MKTNAAGQLLGYTIQFPRALYHLLKCSEGDQVSVEVLGDVATEYSSGLVATEEDKSSITGNPLTNRSTDLWKTFFNWVNAVISGELNLAKTRFILYTNQSGRTALVDKFHAADNYGLAKIACEAAIEELADINDQHEIWPFYNLVINNNRSILIEIIKRFELQIGNGAGADEVKKELKKVYCPNPHIEFVFDHLSGWLQNKILADIAKGLPAIITWEELQQTIMPLFERVRRRELIDFTRQYPPSPSQITKERLDMPLYLQQLEFISCDDDELIEAATEFIKAKVNRERWIETETIDETVATDFENRLTEFWKNTMKGIPIANKSATIEEQGKLILLACKSRQEAIRDQTPPASTIAGTYHALVNGRQCGWHRDWQTKCL